MVDIVSANEITSNKDSEIFFARYFAILLSY